MPSNRYAKNGFMINREDLNNRFKKVFARLEAEGLIVKGSHDGNSRGDFAKKLGTKGHIIQKYLEENAERKITPEQAEKLCLHFGVRREFLLHGQGPMFLSERAEQIRANSNAVSLPKTTGQVFYSSAEAFASSTLDVSSIEEGQQFELPGIEGHFIAFDVKGPSMAPTIREGGTVLCQLLENKEELENGKIYAIITKHGLMVKRVERCINEAGDWTGLRLISDNKSEYPPFEIDLDEVQKILQVRRLIAAID